MYATYRTVSAVGKPQASVSSSMQADDKTFGRSRDLAKHVQPKDEAQREFHERVIRYVRAELGILLENTSKFSVHIAV